METTAPSKEIAEDSEQPVHLGSVLVIDVVGYSKTSTQRQEAIFQELTEIVKGCPAYLAAERAGDVKGNMTGDGYVLEFRKDFLAPAKISDEYKKVALKASFSVRMSIHIGVVADTKELRAQDVVIGEGLNIAFRAIQWALPGEVVITQRACELLREVDAYRIRMRPLGTFPIKHGSALKIYSFEAAPDPLANLYSERLRREIPWAKRLRDGARHRRNLDPASEERIADRLIDFKREAKYGVVVVAIALFVHGISEGLTPFKLANIKGYQTLATFMTSPSGTPPITVIDIGTNLDDHAHQTRLDKLGDLLNQVAVLRPRAIAIDIDMGPNENGQQRDPNKEFRGLAEHLTKDKHMPVFFAVNRWLYYEGKDYVLGEGFGNLIASPHIPKDLGQGQILLAKSVNIGEGYPTLGFALANAYKPQRPLNSRLLSTNVEQKEFAVQLAAGNTKDSSAGQGVAGRSKATAEEVDHFFGGQFPVNYGGLRKIVSECTIHLDRQANLEGDEKASRLIPGSMVVIGEDTSLVQPPVPIQDRDQWKLPNGESLAGMYYHALAAWTLALAPIYRFSTPAYWAITIVFALLSYALPLFIRWRRLADKDPKHPPESLIVIGMAVFTCVFAIVCMRLWSVMFTGYFAAAVLTLAHPVVERLVRVFSRWIVVWVDVRSHLPRAVRVSP